MQFYGSDEGLLTSNVSQYLLQGLQCGESLFVIATPAHRAAFVRRLAAAGADAEAAVREERLILLDARQTLDRLMLRGQPDWDRFQNTVGAAVRQAKDRAAGSGLRVFGEMVGLLWRAGRYSAAVRLEQFWNKLIVSSGLQLFCAYPIDILGPEFQIGGVGALLRTHSHVLPGGSGEAVEAAIDRALVERLGKKPDGLRIPVEDHHRPSCAAIPKPEATVLWLRNNLPAQADEILTRARRYYNAAR